MNDKNNCIDTTLAKVRDYWYLHPELRLGQILSIMAKGDPFYLEDEKLNHCLDEALKKDFISKMHTLVENEDIERAHYEGEEILCKVLISEGYEDLVNEYNKIKHKAPKW